MMIRNKEGKDDHRQVLILGACGMDRLLTVRRYPEAEQKVRSLQSVEVGGGNAANVAHAMALLLNGSASIDDDDDHDGNGNDSDGDGNTKGIYPEIQLATKVGDDAIGDAVRVELQTSGVELHRDLFQAVPATTTGLTTIIVGAEDHTRTCIHTPGTCGEWTEEEVAAVTNASNTGEDAFWKGVCHFHSDARHTQAALLLARQAKDRRVPVSLDVEKDRGTPALDELLTISDLIFTNALQIEDYLAKLNRQAEQEQQRLPLGEPVVAVEETASVKWDPSDGLIKDLVYALRPTTFFARWFGQVGKEVIITKGNKGSIHVVCESLSTISTSDVDIMHPHEVKLFFTEADPMGARNHVDIDEIEADVRVEQRFVDRSSLNSVDGQYNDRIVHVVYKIRYVGIWPNVTSIVDTTGAGDSFLGGYLAAVWWGKCTGYDTTIYDRLRLGTWVAAQKIQGPGSRTTLPNRAKRDADLGPSPNLAFAKLRKTIGKFGVPNPQQEDLPAK